MGTFTFSRNSSGYQCDLPTAKYNMGEEKTITLTPSPYQAMGTGTPYMDFLRYGESVTTENFSRVGDSFVLVTDFFPFAGEPSDDYTLSGIIRVVSGGEPKTVNYKVTNDLTDCESNFQDGYIQANGGVTVKITCSSRYEFETVPVMQRVGAAKQYTFTKVSETEYSYTFTPTAGYEYKFTAIAYKRTPISDKYGFVLSYRLSREEVLEVAAKRWVEVNFDEKKYQGVTVLYVPNEQYIDTAKYVVNFFKLFVTLETTLKHPLQFGPYDMGMECDLIADDIITLDFGSVDIVGKYGNSIDYKNTEIEIYLPFIGFTTLAPADFMDRTVKLEYQVNTLNGDALAVIYADGQKLFSQSCNVAMKIPFQLGANEFLSTSLEPNNNYLLETPPFILVKTSKATDENEHLPYNDTKFYSHLGLLSGYTEAQEIDFVVVSDHITRPEIEEIISMLNSGVFL